MIVSYQMEERYMNIFLLGLTMGLAYVAPIGMQNLFVINSALTNKRKRCTADSTDRHLF